MKPSSLTLTTFAGFFDNDCDNVNAKRGMHIIDYTIEL